MKERAIIDIHTHQANFWLGRELSTEESARLLLQKMDQAGVCISALLGAVSPGQTPEQAHQSIVNTEATVKQAPNRLFGLVYINPTMQADRLREELDHYLSSSHFRGIKLELDLNCRDKRMDVLMGKAIEHNVPVLHHSWYVNTWNMSASERAVQQCRSEPHDIADLAMRFPEAKIIMAHLEGSGIRGILDVADCPNVWIDTSGSQPFTGTLEFAVETLGSKRILFGSDLMGRGLETQLARVYGARLAEGDLENILRRNAQELFGIRGETLL